MAVGDTVSLHMTKVINQVRARRGIRPLRSSGLLQRTAKGKARRLARPHTAFAHDRNLHISRRFGWVGEVLATTTGTTRTQKIVKMWLNSPPHRALLLSRNFRQMGTGRVKRKDGRVFWVTQFGRYGKGRG